MYTEERLRSKFNIETYRFFGETSLREFLRAEKILSKRKDKSDCNISIDENSSFTISGDSMIYKKEIPLNQDGKYIKINVTKTLDIDSIDITLEYRLNGFDLLSQERFDRKIAKVDYTYNNRKVSINNVEDELFCNNLEEKKRKEINKRVLELKK